jgi:hypothetical protein
LKRQRWPTKGQSWSAGGQAGLNDPSVGQSQASRGLRKLGAGLGTAKIAHRKHLFCSYLLKSGQFYRPVGWGEGQGDGI